MKLSEAITIGAARGPQLFGLTSDDHGGSCALGAALLAVGHQTEYAYSDVLDFFPLSRKIATDPITMQPSSIMTILRRLNDEHRWTRERIAEWVVSIEENRFA